MRQQSGIVFVAVIICIASVFQGYLPKLMISFLPHNGESQFWQVTLEYSDIFQPQRACFAEHNSPVALGLLTFSSYPHLVSLQLKGESHLVARLVVHARKGHRGKRFSLVFDAR